MPRTPPASWSSAGKGLPSPTFRGISGPARWAARSGWFWGAPLGRRPAGGENPEPRHRLEPGKSAFGDRRDLGKLRQPVTAADPEQLDLPAFPRLHRRARVAENTMG